MTDVYYMSLALEEAKKAAEMGEVPVGAVIVKNDEVIVRAHNLRETANDATAHAEIIAIRKASKKLKTWRLTDCSLYVTLEPCPMCAGAILNGRISRLVYGAMDVKGGAAESVFAILTNENMRGKTEIRAGVLEDECKEILRKFFGR